MARVELSARPEPLQISNDTTAIIVNDMRNAFCSAGGYLAEWVRPVPSARNC